MSCTVRGSVPPSSPRSTHPHCLKCRWGYPLVPQSLYHAAVRTLSTGHGGARSLKGQGSSLVLGRSRYKVICVNIDILGVRTRTECYARTSPFACQSVGRPQSFRVVHLGQYGCIRYLWFSVGRGAVVKKTVTGESSNLINLSQYDMNKNVDGFMHLRLASQDDFTYFYLVSYYSKMMPHAEDIV